MARNGQGGIEFSKQFYVTLVLFILLIPWEAIERAGSLLGTAIFNEQVFLRYCYGLNINVSPNPYVGTLIPRVMVIGGRAFEK